ncbi:MAG: CFI-box-CTERM domain-containing protein [Nitrosarchaeum sp.]|jgi:hypothetical protein|uniref:CFI-box-CTERM domain-containing protein n=1 Tax=Nitrosarchaeum sp. TaxID=2026886 RepID=UPI002DF1983B|nr:CFI-box-CTERM domain-containing protein [Nitrosarchaeum sp.]
MKLVLVMLLIPLLIIPAFAQTNSQTLQTEKGTLDVKLAYDDIISGEQTNLHIDFINPQTKKIQEHIDYSITVSKEGTSVFGPIPLTHTSLGSVKIPVEFIDDGVYSVELGIEGILFQPIPLEKVSFDVSVGEAFAQPPPINDKNGGACLIATATFGSELSPQVQELRELRDNTILSTDSGTTFMTTFNQFYYSFSPMIADYEREQPIFKEVVKISLTPMLTSLSILNHVDIDSEQEMIGYGVGIILMNIGMYIGIPVFGILKIYQYNRK